MNTKEFFATHGYAIYKGYKIGQALSGDIYVEKDRTLIGWAKTVADAERIINSLYDEGHD